MQLTASQKRGLLALLGICVTLAAVRIWWAGDSTPLAGATKNETGSAAAALSIIDINAADAATFESLPGIGPVLAGRIVKFRTKIEGFATVDELKKVYGLDSALLERLRPRLTVGPYETKDEPTAYTAAIADAPAFNHSQKEAATIPKNPGRKTSGGKMDLVPPLDLNLADSLSLLAVPGIGPGTAGRIISYRNRLGFFHHTDQLAEVWGLRPENLERMKKSLIVNKNTDLMPHIRLTKAEVNRLNRHPYGGYQVGRVVEAFVNEHGEIRSFKDCFAIRGVEAGVWTRLAPYLQF